MKKLVIVVLMLISAIMFAPAEREAHAIPATSAWFIVFDGTEDDLPEWLGIDPVTGEYIGEVDPWGIPGRIGPCPAFNEPVCGDDGSGEIVDGGETAILLWGSYRFHIYVRHTSGGGSGGGGGGCENNDGNPNHCYEPNNDPPGDGGNTEYTQCPGGDSPDYDPNNPDCWRYG